MIAIFLSLIGKFGALIQTIPQGVMGGVSFVLFGMIASIGVRTLVDAQPDLGDMRNSIVVFTILIVGIVSLQGEGNPASIPLTEYASLSGLSLAAIVGVSLNALVNIIMPYFFQEKETTKPARDEQSSGQLAMEKGK